MTFDIDNPRQKEFDDGILREATARANAAAVDKSAVHQAFLRALPGEAFTWYHGLRKILPMAGADDRGAFFAFLGSRDPFVVTNLVDTALSIDSMLSVPALQALEETRNRRVTTLARWILRG